jgi:hypothetical protein
VKPPLAIFFHSYLSGNGVEFGHASEIFLELTQAANASGLADAADEYVIGSSGGEANYIAACTMACPKATIVENPLDSIAELPTLQLAHDWAKANPTGRVWYWHLKGALHNAGTKTTWTIWRHCCSNAVIWGWRECMKGLNGGFDTAGAHWISPERYPSLCSSSYWGGNFWCATSKHLARLVPIDHINWSRYHGEAWIGYVPKGQNITPMKFANHFPMQGCGQ